MARKANGVKSLIQTIIDQAEVLGATQLKVWKRPRTEVEKLVRTDYGAALRRHLNRDQVEELEVRSLQVWPHFNRKALGPPSRKAYSDAAGTLQLHLKAAPYNGLALRGFYVDRSEAALRKPLIYVNSAHHSLAVGTTFCHEVGHHLYNQIIKPEQAGVRLFFDAVYSVHLEEAGELAADAVASLAGYPRPAAEKVFGTDTSALAKYATGNLGDAVFERIRTYIREAYGFDFSGQLPPDQNLHYMAGMIHYAKLRIALLSEYGI